IDVSTGSVVGLWGIIATLRLMNGFPTLTAVAAAILSGALFGVVNGVMVGFFKVDAMLSTFATSMVALGINFWVGRGSTILLWGEGARQSFLSIGQGTVWGIPVPALISLFIAVVTYFLVERTAWGWRLYAVG